MNKLNLFSLEIMHLNFIDGNDLLNISQISKLASQKYYSKSPLWKFICTSQFDIPSCPSCPSCPSSKPQDYKSYFIKYNKLLNSIDY